MSSLNEVELTDRQRRELEYHREHAKNGEKLLHKPMSWDVLDNPARRWWNAYWRMFAYLLRSELPGRRVLVVGCGFGEDAIRLAKVGAKVSAFDLSNDSLAIARKLSEREGLDIAFDQMASEQLHYPDNSFDCILLRDILHHVDIHRTMRELVRVAKPNALVVINEIYSHSITERIRRSRVVERLLYPAMRRFIYGTTSPYITEDERKLTEVDLAEISSHLQSRDLNEYFNFLVTRIIPDRYAALAKFDRILLITLKPFGHLLGGRVLLSARVRK